MARIALQGKPWFIVRARTVGPAGERKVCDVHCLTKDGQYYKQPLLTLTDPAKWTEKVGKVGSIDPQHWDYSGEDHTPQSQRFVSEAWEHADANYQPDF